MPAKTTSSFISLPQDALSDSKQTLLPVLIRYHKAAGDTSGNKIALHKNMFHLLIQGEKKIQYAEKQAQSFTDHVLLLSAGQCITAERVTPGEFFESIIIYFDDAVLSDFCLKYQHLLPTSPYKLAKEPFLRFPTDEYLRHYMLSLKSLLKEKHQLPSELHLLKWEELMLYLFECYPAEMQSFRQKTDVYETELLLKRTVEANLTGKLSVSELAFLCHMSLSTFKRHFFSLYGEAPGTYFARRKMEFAAELLLKGHSPTEVADTTGYEHISSFVQAFKAHFGTTPKAYQTKGSDVLR